MSLIIGAFVSSLLPLQVLGYGDPFPVLCCCGLGVQSTCTPGVPSPGEGCLAPFCSSLLQKGLIEQETALHIGKTHWGAAHHGSCPTGCVCDALLLGCEVSHVPRCSAEPSEVGIHFRIIHHCEVLDCNAASLFQSYVSMKIQPSYTVAKKIWGSRGLNLPCFPSGGILVQLFPISKSPTYAGNCESVISDAFRNWSLETDWLQLTSCM